MYPPTWVFSALKNLACVSAKPSNLSEAAAMGAYAIKRSALRTQIV